MKQRTKDLIVINNMFVGKFLKQGKNIGHEVINLVNADNGKSYVYVCPYGECSSDKAGKISVINVESATGTQRVKVVNIAVGCKAFCEDEIRLIKYGGKDFLRIFENNRGDKRSRNVTFTATAVYYPESDFYITTGSDNGDENTVFVNKNVRSQSLHTVYWSDEESFDALEKLIDEIVEKGKKEEESAYDIQEEPLCFLEIANKRNNELIYSNLIAYYLGESADLLKEFLEEFVDNKKGMSFASSAGGMIVLREYEHIDILIGERDSADGMFKKVVIIENKIDATLHDNQLERYWNNEKLQNAEKVGLVIHPEYRKDISDPYLDNGSYTLLSYSELYDFFKKYQNKEKLEYYKEFINTLRIHSTDTNQINKRQMRVLFKKRIDSITD